MRKCTNVEKDRLYHYISGEPEVNLFIYGDLEIYGVEQDPVTVYVIDASKETLKSGQDYEVIILKYFQNYIVYSHTLDYPITAVVTFLQRSQIDCISGKTSIIKKLEPYFSSFTLSSTYLSRCNQLNPVFPKQTSCILRALEPKDAPDIISLFLSVKEFAPNYLGKEEAQIIQTRENLLHQGRGFGFYDQDRLVSLALTTASNSKSAMIVGVATLEEYQNQGLASAAVSKLCTSSFLEGKDFLCLFYDNPKAGSIYRKIGFEEIGEYALFR